MSGFDLRLSPAHHDLVERTHRFAADVIRPVAEEYDKKEEFPWPVLEEAARQGFYNPLFYRDLIGDPTGLSLPLFMEELFWGCAGIGLAIVMPALALSAMAQAATPEQLLRWAPECFGTPGDIKLAGLALRPLCFVHRFERNTQQDMQPLPLRLQEHLDNFSCPMPQEFPCSLLLVEMQA